MSIMHVTLGIFQLLFGSFFLFTAFYSLEENLERYNASIGDKIIFWTLIVMFVVMIFTGFALIVDWP